MAMIKDILKTKGIVPALTELGYVEIKPLW